MARWRTPRCASAYSIGILVGIGLACGGGGGNAGDHHDDNNFREDVIDCEDALARLQSCCPGFDPTRIRCEHRDDSSSGCDTTNFDREAPSLNLDESRCIRDTDCATLIQDKVCDRAQAAVPYSASGYTTTCYEDSSSGCSSGRAGGSGGGSGGYGGSGYSYECGQTTVSSHPPVCP